MSSTYFELTLTPSHSKEFFLDFIFSLGLDAVEEKGESLIIRSEDSLDEVEWGIREYAKRLEEALGKNLIVEISNEIKKNEDWIGKYKESVQPIEIGEIYIHPSWIEKREDKINVLIDPALAFGSGHHQSTYGCLLMLQKYLPLNANLLDVGCGSGILGISASKLGASVDVCDTDEQAVESAHENFKLNDSRSENSWVGSVNKREKEYDVVMANIIADVLIMLAKDLIAAVKPGGILILSGVLDKYEERIKSRFGVMKLEEMYVKDEWHTFVYRKGSANE